MKKNLKKTIKHKEAGPGLWNFMNHYIPYEILVTVEDYRSAYKYVTKYKTHIVAYDPVKGWRVPHDIFISKESILEQYSNIIYNQEIFEQVVKKVFDEGYKS